jgi:RNA polymerase sigma-70 factor (ECF subfamily)
MALILVDFEGISQVELAKRIGLSVSAAKSRVQRARTQLRALIEACCQIDTDIYGNFIDCRRTGSWLTCDWFVSSVLARDKRGAADDV